MNNDAIKQGAYYLLRGGTLLSEPCKKCGNLQIKFKGNIICMTCKNDNEPNNIEIGPQLTTISSEKNREKVEHDSLPVPNLSETTTTDIQSLLQEIELGITRNLSFASTKLSTTSDLIEYQNIGNIVEQSLRIIKLIKDIRNT
jgi:uncharacterized Zn finger protein (UPF0148 family)